MAAKYNDLDFCDHTRGIDNLLERYHQDRNETLAYMIMDTDKLLETIWKQDSPLSIDNDCKCNLSNAFTSYACSQCKNLKKIVDLKIGAVNKPFMIQCGDLAGKSLLISAEASSQQQLKRDETAAARAKHYRQQYSKLSSCGTPDVKDAISGDSFTIQCLITWLVNKLFEEKGLPHCPILHSAFVCNRVGYQLKEYQSKMDLVKITPSTARSLILQLMVALTELTTISFSHGNPTFDSLIFTKEPVSYLYNEIDVTGPITLQITNLTNSSASVNGTHFFPQNIKSEMCMQSNMFSPVIYSKPIVMAHCSSTVNQDDKVCKPETAVLYKLSSKTMEIYNAIRHIGFPLYSGSFDFYCFMLSLMLQKSFNDCVMSDHNLHRLWAMMWIEEDLIEVEKQLGQKLQVIDIIKNKQLRCDILDHLWSLIKMGW